MALSWQTSLEAGNPQCQTSICLLETRVSSRDILVRQAAFWIRGNQKAAAYLEPQWRGDKGKGDGLLPTKYSCDMSVEV